MELYDIEHLDGAIMYGIVNEKLRLECSSLDDLLLQLDVDHQTFQKKLDAMGYYYDPAVNQLRFK